MKNRNSIKFVGFLVYRPSSDEYLCSMSVSPRHQVETYTKHPEKAFICQGEDFALMVASKLKDACISVPLYETKKKFIVAFPTAIIEDDLQTCGLWPL